MGITTSPPNTTDHTTLKLVAAARLPASYPDTFKPETEVASKKSLHSNSPELKPEDLVQISKLKARDTQVHQHEQAHLSAAAGLDVSNASFTYEKGPNGVNYAVSGEVRIDTSPGHTPEETLARAEMIRNAALAPADPSAVDRSVAAKAQNMAQQARIDIQQQENHLNSKPGGHQSIVNQAYDSRDTVKAKIDTFV
jgi:hypothetical protein